MLKNKKKVIKALVVIFIVVYHKIDYNMTN